MAPTDPCPFFFGRPVPPDQFIGRASALDYVTRRFSTSGQSSALVGEPCSGKTSFLHYLASPQWAARSSDLRNADAELIFSFVDAQTLATADEASFWATALAPAIERGIITTDLLASKLEQTFQALHRKRIRLVLLIDEFDLLLSHAALGQVSFFRTQRALESSPHHRSFARVIATRHSVQELERSLRHLHRAGSPPFNTMDDTYLGVFGKEELDRLLSATRAFSAEDRELVRRLSGGHASVAQHLAETLWHAYRSGERDAERRRSEAARKADTFVSRILSDALYHWTPNQKGTFALVALAPHMNREDQKKAERRLRERTDELEDLRQKGFVSKDPACPVGWRVGPELFARWIEREAEQLRASEDLQELRLGSTKRTSSPEIFICYSREDSALKKELLEHLAPIRRKGSAAIWHDGLIDPGTAWDEQISKKLRSADLVLLLVSASFHDSEYIWSQELRPALDRARRGSAQVMPILVRPCELSDELASLQALPVDEHGRLKAVERWGDRRAHRDEAWAQVARHVKATIEHRAR